MPEIISRAAWGARYRDGVGTRSFPCTVDFLHHSVTWAPPAGATLAQDITAVRKLEDVGYARFGITVPYNFAIPPSGRIFRGVSEHRIGAHTKGYNTSGIGIALIGNYETAAPTQAQKDAIVWLLRNLRSRGILAPSAVLRGHYQVAATACPGKNVKPFIPVLEAESRKVPTEGGAEVADRIIIVIAPAGSPREKAVLKAAETQRLRSYIIDPAAVRITRQNPKGAPQ